MGCPGLPFFGVALIISDEIFIKECSSIFEKFFPKYKILKMHLFVMFCRVLHLWPKLCLSSVLIKSQDFINKYRIFNMFRPRYDFLNQHGNRPLNLLLHGEKERQEDLLMV